jgi:hypothetical protein
LILDALEGRGAHDVELRWHTRARAERHGAVVRVVGPEGAALQMVTVPALDFEVKTAAAGDDEGWIASSYTELQAGTVLAGRGHFSFPTVVATFFSPRTGNDPIGLSLDTISGGVRVRLHAPDRSLDLEVPEGGIPHERAS